MTKNKEALAKLKDMLKPLLGNALERHEALKKGEELDSVAGPLLDLALAKWIPAEEDGHVFELTGCNIAAS